MNDKKFPFTSLCIVTEINYKGTGTLKRLADFEDGRLQSQLKFSASLYKTLRNDNCALPVNSIGVFNWRTESHLRWDDENYTDSELCSDKFPVEIIILQSCFNQQDLRNRLLNGIKFNFSTDRILIAYHVIDDVYHGVLCSEDDFRQTNDEKKIRTDDLKLFEINAQDFIRVEDKIFYRRLELEKPMGVFHTKNLTEFIKDKIILHVNQSAVKNHFSEADLQTIRNFIKNCSSEDFYQEIAKEYSIPADEVKKIFEEFIRVNDKYLQSELLDDEIFATIIQGCPSLFEKCEQTAARKWQTDNEQKITDSNRQIEKLSFYLKKFRQISSKI